VDGRSAYRWWVLASVVAVNILVTGAAWNHVIMVVPELLGDLGLELDAWGTLWSGIPLGVLVFSIPAGVLCDRFGVRRALGVGLALVGVCLLLRAQAQSFASLLATMVAFGVSLSLVLVNFPKAVAGWFPAEELGLANGASQAGVGLGVGGASLLTPMLVGPIGGWRSLTEVLGYVTLGLAALWLVSIRDPRVEAAVSGEAPRPLDSFLGVMRLRDVSLLALCYMLYMGGYLGAMGYLPTHLQTAQGLSGEAAGAIILVGSICFIIGSLVLPTVSDRVGLRRAVYLPGMLVGGLAILAVALVAGAPLVVAIAAFGFGTGVVGLLFVIPVELPGVGAARAGSAVGVATTAGFLGGALSPVIGMSLVAASPVSGFGFWAACLVGSAFLILAVRETGSRAASP
jgi:CP family cyanate transporter-like MFS transporter